MKFQGKPYKLVAAGQPEGKMCRFSDKENMNKANLKLIEEEKDMYNAKGNRFEHGRISHNINLK